MRPVLLLAPPGDGVAEALAARGLDVVTRGEADALVTVGPPPALRPLAELGATGFSERFRLWVEEPFWQVQAWLRSVLARGAAGRWVAVTSFLGTQPFPGGGGDGASARALETLVRIAALEYGSRGLRANAVAAGWRAGALPVELDPELALVDTPSGRLTTDADLADAIAWLLSPEAAQVNGAILRVDGGYTITRGSRPDPGKERR